MPEKAGFLSFSQKASSSLLQWRLHVLTALVLVGVVAVWSIDACTLKRFIHSWRFKQQYLNMKVNTQKANHSILVKDQNFTVDVNVSGYSVVESERSKENLTVVVSGLNYSNGVLEKVRSDINYSNGVLEKVRSDRSDSEWLLNELEPNFTSKLISWWLAPGGEPCRESRTADVVIPELDGKSGVVELVAGNVYEFGFYAVDEFNKSVCLGGDYFETDLSGDSWKSRPFVKDFGNGSYSMRLQVHPNFYGDYNFRIVLLYKHFEGLKFSPGRFVLDKELRRIRIKFKKGSDKLPELQVCQKSDFERDLWAGRWTRHGRNDRCQISHDGRYRCLAHDFPCKSPWCNGSLGSLESNGWVYSSHCAFRLFNAESAWNCLKNRWILFWGDSNHVDTIRNMLNFVLDLPEIKSVPRRFDMNFSNPKDASQSVRITSIFNGHWNETQNYQGLNSLKDEGFRNLLKKYFSEDTVPDTIIMNSGLHDGIYWQNIRRFKGGAEYAASFWKEIMDSIRQRGLVVPQIFYRTTVATGGYARAMAFNPHKMEVFNWIVLEKFRKAGLISGVIDNFDMTFPWHFDNRCNDGVHYGRAPAKMKWRDGEIGHQYFVDLMLAHILLNALCAS